MVVLLDTTVIMEFLKGTKSVSEVIKMLFSKNCEIYYTQFVIFDIFAKIKNKKDEYVINSLFDVFSYIEIDKRIAKKAGEYKKDYPEMQITACFNASCSNILSIPFYTLKTSDYPMTDITFYNPKFNGL